MFLLPSSSTLVCGISRFTLQRKKILWSKSPITLFLHCGDSVFMRARIKSAQHWNEHLQDFESQRHYCRIINYYYHKTSKCRSQSQQQLRYCMVVTSRAPVWCDHDSLSVPACVWYSSYYSWRHVAVEKLKFSVQRTTLQNNDSRASRRLHNENFSQTAAIVQWHLFEDWTN